MTSLPFDTSTTQNASQMTLKMIEQVEATRPAWLPFEEFPFASRFVTINGNNIHYIDEGNGPLLLFLHAPFWSMVYRDVISALKKDFRCIALDLPGTGLSQRSATYNATLAAAADVLDAFVDELGLADITLVIHDIAGPIALDVARRHPHLFRGAAITGSFAWPLAPYQKIARMLRFVGGPLFGAINTGTNFFARLSATSHGVGKRLGVAGRKAFLGPFASRETRKTSTQMLGSAAQSESFLLQIENALQTQLKSLPLLLMYGEKDEGRLAGFQDHFLKLMPHASSLVIEGAHHFPQSDAPFAVAEHIQYWWREKIG